MSESEYLKVLQGKYFMTRGRKEKSAILDEYCKNTGQNRKYVIRKIGFRISLRVRRKGGKEVVCDGYLKVTCPHQLYHFVVWSHLDDGGRESAPARP